MILVSTWNVGAKDEEFEVGPGYMKPSLRKTDKAHQRQKVSVGLTETVASMASESPLFTTSLQPWGLQKTVQSSERHPPDLYSRRERLPRSTSSGHMADLRGSVLISSVPVPGLCAWAREAKSDMVPHRESLSRCRLDFACLSHVLTSLPPQPGS